MSFLWWNQEALAASFPWMPQHNTKQKVSASVDDVKEMSLDAAVVAV